MTAAAAFDALFRPRAIAILGASAVPAKFGYRMVDNLRQGGFEGRVLPISRSSAEIAGCATVPGFDAIEGGIDLALISVAAEHVAQGIADAAAAGARAAVVFSSGFAEQGEEGRALQDRLLARARECGVRVLGPNCMGVRNVRLRMNATPAAVVTPPAGNIAFVSQSGALASAACIALDALGAGMSKLASIGNMADVGSAELLRYLGRDDETAVIAAFIEGVPDAADFLDAVAAVAAVKPVVILKGGRSEFGRLAALSHTSSLAGDGRVWAPLLREAGATVVTGIEELFDAAAAFSRAGKRLPRGRRVALFTVAGGPAVVAADHMAELGLQMPPLDEALAGARAQAPAFASLRNPIDIAGSAPPASFGAAMQALAGVADIDAVLPLGIGVDALHFGESVVAISRHKAVVASLVAAPRLARMLQEAGIPNLPSAERAVKALHHLAERGCACPVGEAASRPLARRPLPAGALTESQAKAFLAHFDMPVTRETVASGLEQALAAAQAIGYPVALKVSSAQVLHKTEQGGVLLGIAGPDALHDAFGRLHQRFPGADVLVQEMIPAGIELIVGAQRRADTGAIVMLGFGGVLTEVLADVAFMRIPATPASALRAVNGLRSARLLDGYRGLPAVNRGALALLAARLSDIVCAHPEIEEVDLNPVIAGPQGLVIVDALIRTQEAQT